MMTIFAAEVGNRVVGIRSLTTLDLDRCLSCRLGFNIRDQGIRKPYG